MKLKHVDTQSFCVTALGILAIVGVFLALSANADDTKKPIDKLLGKCPEGQWYSSSHNECVEGEITEIDGVSMSKIVEVLDAHRDELRMIKGVVSAGIDQHGISVEVLPEHDPLPFTIEGLPLHTHPYAYEVLIGADVNFPTNQ